MGMTLDKAIDIMENYEEYGFLSQENGRNKAINIMHKYQKIQAIAEKCNLKLLPKEAMNTFMKDVLEVVENEAD